MAGLGRRMKGQCRLYDEAGSTGETNEKNLKQGAGKANFKLPERVAHALG
jgi:hypothetical protein